MASETPAAATPPTISWPSPPTLISPARAGMATARPASMIGVARMKISPICFGERKIEWIMSA